MEKILIAFLLICSFTISGQQSEKWLKELEKPEFDSKILKKENLKLKYLHYDFSTLMVPRTKFLGYIGVDYKRIRIYFTSIIKNQADQELYDITGVSIVDNNLCQFKGSIKIQ